MLGTSDHTWSRREEEQVGKARNLMTALVGLLEAAESPAFSSELRAGFTAAATRQATVLRDLLRGRLLFIVALDHSERYEPLKRVFAFDHAVEVILDRR